MKLQKEKLIIIVTVLIDVIGIGIIIPVMPSYVQSFGVTALGVTSLFAVYSLFSFFSAPLLGALSDKIGRRPVLIASIASTALGWFVFATAHQIWLLFLGRIIDGAAAGNFPIAQSYLVDIARDEKERTTNLGVIGAAFGIGFIIGPTLGGVLANYSPALPFFVVGVLATLNVIGAYFYLPETNSHRHAHANKKVSLNPLKPIISAIRDRPLRSRYAAWFLFGIATAVQQAVLSMYFGLSFGMTAAMIGYTLAFSGIIMAINQGLFLKRFWLKRFKESWLEKWLYVFFALGYAAMGIHHLGVVFCGIVLAMLTQSVLRVVSSSRVAGIAGHARRGEAMGVMSSVQSLAMIIGPLIGGVAFTARPTLPFFIAAVALLGAFAVLMLSHDHFGEKHDDTAGEALAL